jgi:hypothetical protein
VLLGTAPTGGGGTTPAADWKGLWSDATAYAIGDIVYDSASNVWQAQAVNTGVTPVGGADWSLIGTVPTAGGGAVTLYWQGPWSDTQPYDTGDIVFTTGPTKLWVANTAVTGTVPSAAEGTQPWTPVAGGRHGANSENGFNEIFVGTWSGGSDYYGNNGYVEGDTVFYAGHVYECTTSATGDNGSNPVEDSWTLLA